MQYCSVMWISKSKRIRSLSQKWCRNIGSTILATDGFTMLSNLRWHFFFFIFQFSLHLFIINCVAWELNKIQSNESNAWEFILQWKTNFLWRLIMLFYRKAQIVPFDYDEHFVLKSIITLHKMNFFLSHEKCGKILLFLPCRFCLLSWKGLGSRCYRYSHIFCTSTRFLSM